MAIVISTNLKRRELWASKQTCWYHVVQGQSSSCAYKQNTPNSEYLGPQNGMNL